MCIATVRLNQALGWSITLQHGFLVIHSSKPPYLKEWFVNICDRLCINQAFAAFCQNWDTYIARNLIFCTPWWYLWNYEFSYKVTHMHIIVIANRETHHWSNLTLFIMDCMGLSVPEQTYRVQSKRPSNDFPASSSILDIDSYRRDVGKLLSNTNSNNARASVYFPYPRSVYTLWRSRMLLPCENYDAQTLRGGRASTIGTLYGRSVKSNQQHIDTLGLLL